MFPGFPLFLEIYPNTTFPFQAGERSGMNINTWVRGKYVVSALHSDIYSCTSACIHVCTRFTVSFKNFSWIEHAKADFAITLLNWSEYIDVRKLIFSEPQPFDIYVTERASSRAYICIHTMCAYVNVLMHYAYAPISPYSCWYNTKLSHVHKVSCEH